MQECQSYRYVQNEIFSIANIFWETPQLGSLIRSSVWKWTDKNGHTTRLTTHQDIHSFYTSQKKNKCWTPILSIQEPNFISHGQKLFFQYGCCDGHDENWIPKSRTKWSGFTGGNKYVRIRFIGRVFFRENINDMRWTTDPGQSGHAKSPTLTFSQVS